VGPPVVAALEQFFGLGLHTQCLRIEVDNEVTCGLLRECTRRLRERD